MFVQLAAVGKLKDVTWTAREDRHNSPISACRVPRHEAILTRTVLHRAMLRAFRAALAVEQWRMEHGRWPASLEEMAEGELPEALTDPVTHAPIRFWELAGPGKPVRLGLLSLGYAPAPQTGVSVYCAGVAGLHTTDLKCEYVEGAWRMARESGPEFRLRNPEQRGAEDRPLREEILDAYHLSQLKNRGLDAEQLRELGLTDEDLRSLGFGP
jgi:hypothetical protein